MALKGLQAGRKEGQFGQRLSVWSLLVGEQEDLFTPPGPWASSRTRLDVYLRLQSLL